MGRIQFHTKKQGIITAIELSFIYGGVTVLMDEATTELQIPRAVQLAL
jgi:hypothetical protein